MTTIVKHFRRRLTVRLREFVPCVAVAIAAVTLASACNTAGKALEASVPEPALRQVIVAVDLSGSRTADAMLADKRLLNGIVAELRPGDQIVLMRVPEISGHDPERWTATLPSLKDAQHPTTHEQR